MGASDLSSYLELLEEIAIKCDGFSGAALAGVARAAASHALERAVGEFSEHGTGSMMDCLVTKVDFERAVAEVRTGMGNADHSEEARDSEQGEITKEITNDGLSPL